MSINLFFNDIIGPIKNFLMRKMVQCGFVLFKFSHKSFDFSNITIKLTVQYVASYSLFIIWPNYMILNQGY